MSRFLGLSGQNLAGSTREVFYRQAWLFFAYLRADGHRTGQLKAFIDNIRNGASYDISRLAFGDTDKIFSDLMVFLRTNAQPQAINATISIGRGRAIVVPLQPAEQEALPYQIALQVDPAAIARAPSLLPIIRSLALKYPESAEVQRLAAMTLNSIGQNEEALDHVDKALTFAPDHQRTLLLKGEILLDRLATLKSKDAKAWQMARTWVFRANKANTEDALPLITYFRSFEQQGVAPPADAFASLRKAYELVPEDPAVRLAYGIAMILHGQRAEAVNALTILANAPHENGISVKARELLARIAAPTR